MKIMMRRAVAVSASVAVVGVGLLVAAAPAEARATPTVLKYDSKFARKPTTIRYTGDGSGYIGKIPWGSHPGTLKWTKWSTSSATGRGTVWLNDCNPYCGAGYFHAYAGTVKLTKPSRHHFTRMTIRFTYNGRTVTDIRALQHLGSYYGWRIVSQSGF